MIADLVVTFVFILFAMVMLLGLATLLTWVERKLSAMMADRIGANRCYVKIPLINVKLIALGLFHAMADGLKMMSKERFIPKDADKFLFLLAPWIVFAPVLLMFALIPFGGIIYPEKIFGSFFAGKAYLMQIAPLDGGALIILAISGICIIGVVLAGWASNNKYSLLGSIRAASQMISYEVALGLSLLPMVLTYGSLDLHTMIVAQQGSMLGGVLPAWGIFLSPLTAIIYLTAATAENKRIPFDIPEAESEIIAGFFTEYSGMRMALFMFAEFAEIVIISCVFVVFFLGGYNLPYWDFAGSFPRLAIVLWPTIFFIKVFIVSCFQILVRWSLPRFRYDQLLTFGWKFLLPLAMVNITVVTLFLWLVQKHQ
ncbi:MAG: NADH-quinone oxidoreductase subunit H [Oligoflexia bacterium]|nr:NADH-quinone oxidoreductase subunit H [Oligoflexia bacterium]MBF0366269.1 NADH-quinone oxidoreductase subunit H [Oligoflexia bacterium]